MKNNMKHIKNTRSSPKVAEITNRHFSEGTTMQQQKKNNFAKQTHSNNSNNKRLQLKITIL